MAFDNVTLFEVHLDDAKFSSVFGNDDVEAVPADADVAAMDEMAMDDEMMEMDEDVAEASSSGAGKGRGFARFLALAAVLGVTVAVVRRRRARKAAAGMDEAEMTQAELDESEFSHVGTEDDDVESVEIEGAAE